MILLTEQLIENEPESEDILPETREENLCEGSFARNVLSDKLLSEIRSRTNTLKPVIASEKESFIEMGDVRIRKFVEIILKVNEMMNLNSSKEIKLATLYNLRGAIDYFSSESISKKKLEKQIRTERLDPLLLASFVETAFEEVEKFSLVKCKTDLEKKIILLENELQVEVEKNHEKRRESGLTTSTFFPTTPGNGEEPEYEEGDYGFVLVPHDKPIEEDSQKCEPEFLNNLASTNEEKSRQKR